MRYLKFLALFILCMSICTSVCAKEFTIDEFGIENISIPDEFMVCERDTCDEKFAGLLSANSFTFESWYGEVMKPNNYYIYATDDKNHCVYIVCEKNKIQKTITNKDGSKTHKLMSDYNMLDDGDKRQEQITKTKDALLLEGLSPDEITTLGWADLGDDIITPYVEYVCNVGGQSLHCYDTVYNAYTISFQFTKPGNFNSSDYEMHRELVKNIKFNEAADYSEARQVENDNLQKKLAEETHSGENTKIIRVILSVSIAIVIVFSVFMAIKTQSKKRRKTIVLREHEVIPEENEEEGVN